jgi:hypothetical protein
VVFSDACRDYSYTPTHIPRLSARLDRRPQASGPPSTPAIGKSREAQSVYTEKLKTQAFIHIYCNIMCNITARCTLRVSCCRVSLQTSYYKVQLYMQCALP